MDEILRDSEEMLNSGEYERLIRMAQNTVARASALGRLDIAEKAQAIIDDLTEKQNRLAETHRNLLEIMCSLPE